MDRAAVARAEVVRAALLVALLLAAFGVAGALEYQDRVATPRPSAEWVARW